MKPVLIVIDLINEIAHVNGKILLENSWGTEFIKPLNYDAENDIAIIKTRVSPFYKTELLDRLKSLEVGTIVLSGVATNNAIALCAREAWDRDFNVIIVTDACAAGNEEIHTQTLKILPPFIKKQITDELTNNLRSH